MTQRGQDRRLWRAIYYGLPVLAWSAIAYFGATEWGRYERSWRLVQNSLHLLAPEWPVDAPNGIQVNVSMYEINSALRRVAHVVTYAILTGLVVRLIQQGAPRLKRASVVGAVLIAALYVATDEWLRWHEAHRHAKAIDIYLNLIGIVCVLGATFLYFALKAWERGFHGEEGQRHAE